MHKKKGASEKEVKESGWKPLQRAMSNRGRSLRKFGHLTYDLPGRQYLALFYMAYHSLRYWLPASHIEVEMCARDFVPGSSQAQMPRQILKVAASSRLCLG